jgi:hypothetical protein
VRISSRKIRGSLNPLDYSSVWLFLARLHGGGGGEVCIGGDSGFKAYKSIPSDWRN